MKNLVSGLQIGVLHDWIYVFLRPSPAPLRPKTNRFGTKDPGTKCGHEYSVYNCITVVDFLFKQHEKQLSDPIKLENEKDIHRTSRRRYNRWHKVG